MLFPTPLRATTPRHTELIYYMNLTCFKNGQITCNSLRNSKGASDLSKDFRPLRSIAIFFFKKGRRNETWSGHSGTVSCLVSPILYTIDTYTESVEFHDALNTYNVDTSVIPVFS